VDLVSTFLPKVLFHRLAQAIFALAFFGQL